MAKFKTGCPGQNTGYLKDFNTSLVSCPKCGHQIEFFADERKVSCPRCHARVYRMDEQVADYVDGKLVFKDPEKSCLDWCGGCLDSRDYKEIEQHKQRLEEKKKDFSSLIESVDEEDSEAIEFFLEAFAKSANSSKLIDDRLFSILQKKNPDLFVRVRNYYLNFLR
jgi:DNA-directed RNA polymerase subunit RPC12/RpoP